MLEDLLQPIIQINEQYVDVTLKEAYNGSTRLVALQRRELCPKCLGIGSNGIFSFPCETCHAEGLVVGQVKVQLSIPGGVDTGFSTRIQVGFLYAQPDAEIVVVYRVHSDAMFSRQGSDLYTTLRIASDLAQTGGTPTVMLPDGKLIAFPLAPRTQDGAVIPLIGRGMPLFNDSSHRGDLYIRVVVTDGLDSPWLPNAALPQGEVMVGHSPTSPRALVGAKVPTRIGNYLIVRQIGAGGAGSVYLGKHYRLNSYAAIKVLREITAEQEQNFLHEAQTLASLKHPNVLRVLDFGTEGNFPFLVMDYAERGSLREHHPKGSRLSLKQIVSYVKQIASALHYAHDKQVIHRDVKPDNLLLDQTGTLLLSDFGIAVAVQEHRTQSMHLETPYGTYYYAAPEQVRGYPRPASDQYALGIVVYEWLCGCCPFEGSLAEVVNQHRMTPPPPLRKRNHAIPSAVERVVLKALAKEPHQRFGDVQEFAKVLEAAAHR